MIDLKRKPTDEKIQHEIRNNLISLYFSELQYFSQILLFVLKFDKDLYHRKDRKYNKAVKISLVILKLLNNSQPKNKLKKILRNTDLILIRWTALKSNFFCNREYLKELSKKHPKLLNSPEEYDEAIKYNRVTENNKKDSTKYIDVKWNDFSSYIDPKTIPNDYYYRYITLLAMELDFDNWNLPSAKQLVEDWIKSFLSDIKINTKNLTYTANNLRQKKSSDSFDVVFFSDQWNRSYALTRNRFLEHCFKKVDKKFNEIIHWEEKKNIKKIKKF